MSRDLGPTPPRGFRRRPRVADLMTPELTTFYERSHAAERVGDVEEALEYLRGIPMLRRGRHTSVLEQLAAVKGDLTPWVYARWIVYQSIRADACGSHTGRLLRGAVMDSVETFHADLLGAAYDEGGDP